MTAPSPPSSIFQPSIQSDWLQVEPVWQANTLDLQHKKFIPPLSPSWRLLLLNDGYTTRNLSLLTGSDIAAELIDTRTIDPDRDRAPAAIALLDRPSIRRQVWLTSASGDRLVYGVSWWNPHHLRDYLHHPDQPIGRNLSHRRIELFRELHGLYLGHSETLTQAFRTEGPFWGRHYILWHQQQPITLIAEVFSNSLTRQLGPSQAAANPTEHPCQADGGIDRIAT
ncbi:chorismate lyase [Synechococcus sp. PCC 7336]|uniref:chorismate lyase n=1 Tax=Synechococcus sp. PCC 7336 TaxID=195250 RepID=UPI00034DCA3F|nr:chorismate lyase [Synechococcus sp. PCC 7336]